MIKPIQLIEKLDKIHYQLVNSDISTSVLKSIDMHLSQILLALEKKPTLKDKPVFKNSGTINIWSDGACSGNPGPGGWGTVILENEEYKELSGSLPKTTNNIMEMTGALEGIRQTPEGSSIVLTSDSQYLVKGMTEWIKGWKKRGWKKADGKNVLNKEIWLELDKETSLRTIKWKWVKGHAGHEQNERCDELARTAISSAH